LDAAEPGLDAIEAFPGLINTILEEHRPSRMPLFARLAAVPRPLAREPSFLGQIHLIYQSAMHATRAAVYYLPHLDVRRCASANCRSLLMMTVCLAATPITIS
jgi:hypothetical protein